MLVGRLRIPRHAEGTDPALTRQAIAQDHNQRQRQAIGPKLHRLPALGRVPQLPAIRRIPQTSERPGMGQQNLAGQHPTSVSQAQKNPQDLGEKRDIQQGNGAQGECLSQEVGRQQLP